MRIKGRSGLLPLNLLVIVLVSVIILFPPNTLRIVLGFLFVLFFPGYALMVALFPRKEGMSGIERVALSFGLSIAVVPLIGLIFNYTPWGIRLESMLSSIASFILIISIIAWHRQKGLPEEERFNIEFQLKMPSWGISTRDKVLSITLVLAILSVLGMSGYIIATPKAGEQITEFYILGREGKALKSMLGSTYLNVIEGRAEVRDVFLEDKGGVVAVAVVTEGGKGGEQSWALSRGISVRVWRGKGLVSESVVSSFKRFKGVTETTAGAVSRGHVVQTGATAFALEMPSLADKVGEEYGFGIKGFSEFQVGDILEFFTPTDLAVGKEMTVTVGIANYDNETVSYRVEVRIDGVKNNEVQGITLERGERWENGVSFTPGVAGENQKVEFLLYKNGEVKPFFEPLRLWVDVKVKPS